MIRRTLVSAAVLLSVMLGASAALASQGSGCMPTTGTVSGLTLVTDINAGIKALISSNSGSSAPATDCSGLSLAGQFWLDTSTTPYVLKNYDGTSWLTLGTMDNTNHVWTPPIGGGTNSVTAAGTTDLCSVPQGYVTISGNTTITAFGSSCVAGQIKYLNFTGTPQVTYNGTSLIIPGAATITVAAGDQAVAAYLGSGNWRIVSYTPTSGQALVNPSFPAGFAAYGFAFTAPSGWALSYGQNVSRATFATLLSATTLAQSGVRTSGSPIITSLSDTSQFRGNQPVEGTGIPGGTLILTVDSGTQITLNANATSSGTSTVTVFPNGNGDGSTTFGLPDCRSVVMAGRGNMGGSNRNLLTNTYLQASGTGLGAFGGVDHQTIGTANLPPYTPTGNVQSFTPAGTISAPTITLSAAATNVVNSSSGGGANLTGGGGALLQGTITASASTPVFTGNLLAPNFIGIAQGGTSTPIATVQPTIIANCFIKLTN